MSFPESFADRIARAVIQTYNELPQASKPQYPKYTVLSSVVAHIVDNGEILVLAVATGTKCAAEHIIGGDNSILVDSHAEVLARRAFIRYLLECIERCLCDPNFERVSNCPVKFSVHECKYILKESWNLYLYSSDSPCGDASIYNRIAGRSFSGKKARTCASHNGDNGEYSGEGMLRLKPGRIDLPERCRRLSMSCSDKIAEWMFIGIQGGLLSHLMTAIRLTGIVVGRDPFDAQITYNFIEESAQILALHRALANRQPNVPEKCQDETYASKLKYSEMGINPNPSFCILISSVEFSSGKCASEYVLYTSLNASNKISEPESESDFVKQVRSKDRSHDAITLTPHELSMNWIISCCDIIDRSATIKSAGCGTVEITLSRVGIPQGASLTSKIKPKKFHISNSIDEHDSNIQKAEPKVTSANNIPSREQANHPVSRLCSRELFSIFTRIISMTHAKMGQNIIASFAKSMIPLSTSISYSLDEINKEIDQDSINHHSGTIESSAVYKNEKFESCSKEYNHTEYLMYLTQIHNYEWWKHSHCEHSVLREKFLNYGPFKSWVFIKKNRATTSDAYSIVIDPSEAQKLNGITDRQHQVATKK